jgi:hypothetical protein
MKLKNVLPVIIAGYVIVLVFAFIYIFLLVKGDSLSEKLSQQNTALLIAIVFVLPLIMPVIGRYVAPRIKSLKISELEISFTEAATSGYSLGQLAGQLNTNFENMSVTEYAGMMTSHSHVILETLQILEQTKVEVLVIDLKIGKAWIPPNLYFLTLLLSRRTAVKQIVFVETRKVEQAFVAMCFPDKLNDAIGYAFPVLTEATRQSDLNQIHRDPQVFATSFFGTLSNLYSQNPQAGMVRDQWLNSTNLFNYFKNVLNTRSIEYNPMSETEVKKILVSTYPYVAIVRDEELMFLVDQATLSIDIARKIVSA